MLVPFKRGANIKKETNISFSYINVALLVISNSPIAFGCVFFSDVSCDDEED